jgi:hypothetical protein
MRHDEVVVEVQVGLHSKRRRHGSDKDDGPSDGIDPIKKVAGGGTMG